MALANPSRGDPLLKAGRFNRKLRTEGEQGRREHNRGLACAETSIKGQVSFIWKMESKERVMPIPSAPSQSDLDLFKEEALGRGTLLGLRDEGSQGPALQQLRQAPGSLDAQGLFLRKQPPTSLLGTDTHLSQAIQPNSPISASTKKSHLLGYPFCLGVSTQLEP